MRALRSSMYVDPYKPPLTTVVLEDDTVDTLESITHQHTADNRALVIHEIFEVESDDIASATAEAMRRQEARAEQEGHMTMLYAWTVLTWTHRVKAGGTILMDKPTPLSREEITTVFEQLARRPDYESYTVVSHTTEGKPVWLKNGEIK